MRHRPDGVLFAASNPARTAGLVLVDPTLAFYRDEEARREWAEINDRVRREWGTPAYGPENWSDEREFLDWFVPWSRSCVAPGALATESDAFGDVDVRGLLPSIHVPTLAVVPDDGYGTNPMDDQDWSLMAERIPEATLIRPVRAAGPSWHHWYQRAPAIIDAVGELIVAIEDEQSTFDRVVATVLFTDIVGSSEVASRLGDRGWRELVEHHHATVRSLLARYRGVEVDTAGDGFFATFDGPARAVSCAKAIIEALRPLGIEIRAGVHTGEVETIAGKVGGLAVVIGSRVCALAGASEVLASQTVKDLTAGSGLSFVECGEHELKGVPDRWRLYRVL